MIFNFCLFKILFFKSKIWWTIFFLCDQVLVTKYVTRDYVNKMVTFWTWYPWSHFFVNNCSHFPLDPINTFDIKQSKIEQISCLSNNCSNALIFCKFFYGERQCFQCIKNFKQECSECADDIFDINNLKCVETDPNQAIICHIYCRGKLRQTGFCSSENRNLYIWSRVRNLLFLFSNKI